MTAYSRPPVMPQVFRDAAGDVIRYGERWRLGTDVNPPGDSYSVTSHLERYLPLQTVAEGLIAHLVDTYHPSVSDDVALGSDLLHTREDVIRGVRLTPHNADGAPLTFVFTSFPSVIIVAGAVTQLLHPFCGCDACDEKWEDHADDMEHEVFGIVAGNLREEQVPGEDIRFMTSHWGVDDVREDGFGFSDVMTELATRERIARAVALLASHPHGWAAWVARE